MKEDNASYRFSLEHDSVKHLNSYVSDRCLLHNVKN